ncbi:MAG: NYN domain-containing protein [Candidatus Dependentiae bacterium]|nr:NYN domain-containing protein [Candidatus Dependentiae bacterium]
MIIVIDAYNYIKSVTGQKFIDDRASQKWIETFKHYVGVRHNPIILIFDAGPGYFPSTVRCGGVTVLYSGQQRTADDLIKDWLRAHPGADALLVSSDRELCHSADDANVASIGSYDFYKIFNHVMQVEKENEQNVAQEIYKMIDNKLVDKSSTPLSDLDRLMEQASRVLVKGGLQKDHHEGSPRARGGKKASKPDKQIMRKIDKI